MFAVTAKIIEFMCQRLALLKQLNEHCRWIRMCRHTLVWGECGSGKGATIPSPGVEFLSRTNYLFQPD